MNTRRTFLAQLAALGTAAIAGLSLTKASASAAPVAPPAPVAAPLDDSDRFERDMAAGPVIGQVYRLTRNVVVPVTATVIDCHFSCKPDAMVQVMTAKFWNKSEQGAFSYNSIHLAEGTYTLPKNPVWSRMKGSGKNTVIQTA